MKKTLQEYYESYVEESHNKQGRQYIQEVISYLEAYKVPVTDYHLFFEENRERIGRQFQPSTRRLYETHARNYIRYVQKHEHGQTEKHKSVITTLGGYYERHGETPPN